MNETMTTLLNRRCVRAFRAEQITDEELNAVLEAGKYAPSGANQQSALFIVVQDRDTRETLSRMNRAVNEGILRGFRHGLLTSASRPSSSVG